MLTCWPLASPPHYTLVNPLITLYMSWCHWLTLDRWATLTVATAPTAQNYSHHLYHQKLLSWDSLLYSADRECVCARVCVIMHACVQSSLGHLCQGQRRQLNSLASDCAFRMKELFSTPPPRWRRQNRQTPSFSQLISGQRWHKHTSSQVCVTVRHRRPFQSVRLTDFTRAACPQRKLLNLGNSAAVWKSAVSQTVTSTTPRLMERERTAL